VRVARELPRYLAIGLAGFGLLASARFAIAPPRPEAAVPPVHAPPLADDAAQAYAALFARRYLTWEAAAPLRDERELEPFVGSQLEPAAGFVPPPAGRQSVEWAEVVQAREPGPGRHVYTIAAQTQEAGLVYLSVGVSRVITGRLALSGYPAFVGPPASEPATAAPDLRPDPRNAPNQDCSSTVSYLLFRVGLRQISEIVRANPLAQDYTRWGAPGPGRWVTIFAAASPTPHVFAVVAGLRIDTSHNGTDVGPNRDQDGPRWRVLDGIPRWAHWSVRHPPGL
jgi:hypothetical protein